MCNPQDYTDEPSIPRKSATQIYFNVRFTLVVIREFRRYP